MKLSPFAACLAAVGALIAAPRIAAGEDPKCSVALLPDATATDFPLLYPPRHHELTLEGGYVGSSFPFASAVESTLMYSFAPLDETWHFGLRAGMTAGRWGADHRGPVGLGLGARVAADLWRPMSGVLGIYGFGQADAILLANDGDPVLRPALGVGMRAARTLGLEVSFDPVFSLGSAFANGDKVAGGFGVGLVFDFCAFGSWCNETAPTQTSLDLTQQLYSAASALVPTNPGQKSALCQAVGLALDASRYPPVDEGDPTSAFLAGIVANVSDPIVKAKLEALATKHASLRDELVNPKTGSRIRARLAAQGNHLLVDDCIYSPFPVEIRTALGC